MVVDIPQEEAKETGTYSDLAATPYLQEFNRNTKRNLPVPKLAILLSLFLDSAFWTLSRMSLRICRPVMKTMAPKAISWTMISSVQQW